MASAEDWPSDSKVPLLHTQNGGTGWMGGCVGLGFMLRRVDVMD